MNEEKLRSVVVTKTSAINRDLFAAICEITNLTRSDLFSVMIRDVLTRLIEELGANPATNCNTLDELHRCSELLPKFKVAPGGTVTMV